jgi:hypothetical protein
MMIPMFPGQLLSAQTGSAPPGSAASAGLYRYKLLHLKANYITSFSRKQIVSPPFDNKTSVSEDILVLKG